MSREMTSLAPHPVVGPQARQNETTGRLRGRTGSKALFILERHISILNNENLIYTLKIKKKI